MSTKASIISTPNGTHIYNETSEFIAEKGYVIYWTAFWKEYKDVSFAKNKDITISFRNDKTVVLLKDDVIDAEFDFEGFVITIMPKTKSAELILSLDDYFSNKD